MCSSLPSCPSLRQLCWLAPIPRYNPRLPLTSQLNISGPLLSRFDLVVLLLDRQDPAWDEQVAQHVLDAHMAGPPGAPGTRERQPQQHQQAAASSGACAGEGALERDEAEVRGKTRHVAVGSCC
jgi:DNA replicative helicase MCM subunit Mcm2 (Cdc46/Mcm family)